MTAQKTYVGKYRGSVLNNIDPESIGRVQASVPDVSSLLPTTWAMPCLPVAGIQSGTYFVPAIGAGVWIEFERGDPNHPIWTGCYWGSLAEVPSMALLGAPGDPSMVMQTTLQNTLMLSDLPGPTGGILLRTTAGATISMNETGIVIQNGQGASLSMLGPTITLALASGAMIELAGPSVSINPPALVVT